MYCGFEGWRKLFFADGSGKIRVKALESSIDVSCDINLDDRSEDVEDMPLQLIVFVATSESVQHPVMAAQLRIGSKLLNPWMH